MFHDSIKHQIFFFLIQNVLFSKKDDEFLTLTSSYKLLDQAQLNALETSINTVFEYHDPQQFWVKVIQLITTDTTSSFNPSFFIRQPDEVKMFLIISMKSNKCIDMINFIHSKMLLEVPQIRC